MTGQEPDLAIGGTNCELGIGRHGPEEVTDGGKGAEREDETTERAREGWEGQGIGGHGQER
jgi:hypothetical protein